MTATSAELPARQTGGPDATEEPEIVLGDPSAGRRSAALLIGLAVLVAVAAASLFVGSGDITRSQVINALTGDGQTTTDLLVRDRRLPRMILAIMVGLGLALAGVVMQALTRNPLADPGLLGVNSGAYFAVVIGAAFAGATGTGSQLIFGVLGAGVAAFVVYVLGSSGAGAGTPAKLVLSGVAIGAVLTGISRAITLAKPATFDKIRFWESGSIQGRSWDSVTPAWIGILVAAVAVAALARSLNSLAMGEDMARALGANVGRIKIIGFVCVTILCGISTAVAGPITFVGLLVPFVVKFVVGVDHRWVIAFSAIVGPLLMISADMLARVLHGSELPVGVVTAFLGAPVLVLLVRRTKMTAL